MFDKIDHIGIAVTDLEEAIELYEKTFGMPVTHRETLEEQGVTIAMLRTGDSQIELMQATGDDTPVGRFIAKRGPGMHHVGYAVPDIDAALAELVAAGMRAIDEKPRRGVADSRVAFLHPATIGGVLTELDRGRALGSSHGPAHLDRHRIQPAGGLACLRRGARQPAARRSAARAGTRSRARTER